MVTAALIKELREKTGAGMMDCKKALVEVEADMDAAVDWLRKKGLASAAKKSGRIAAEGLVGVAVDGKKAAIVELNSETDFVARNEQFQELVEGLATAALTAGGDIEALKAQKCEKTGKTSDELITEAIATIGENMTLRRTKLVELENDGVIASYIHNSVKPGLGKIAILVAVESTGDKAKLEALGKQTAMHIAAARPEALSRDDVDLDKMNREREVLKQQAIESGKPAEIAEKMVEGRMRKYFEEVVLLEQISVVSEDKLKVSEVVENLAKELGTEVKITAFTRFELGEGVEKKEDDFAEEVAKAAGAA